MQGEGHLAAPLCPPHYSGGAEANWEWGLQDAPSRGLQAAGRVWGSLCHSPCLGWGRTLETVGDVDVVTMDTERASLGAEAGGEESLALLCSACRVPSVSGILPPWASEGGGPR